MNPRISEVAAEVGLLRRGKERLRFAFALACVERVEHLLDHRLANPGLEALRDAARGLRTVSGLRLPQRQVQRIADAYRGSVAEGAGDFAAASAWHALAHALGGQALETASYAAYAVAYARGGSVMHASPALAIEFAWQVQCLERLGRAATPQLGRGAAALAS